MPRHTPAAPRRGTALGVLTAALTAVLLALTGLRVPPAPPGAAQAVAWAAPAGTAATCRVLAGEDAHSTDGPAPPRLTGEHHRTRPAPAPPGAAALPPRSLPPPPTAGPPAPPAPGATASPRPLTRPHGRAPPAPPGI